MVFRKVEMPLSRALRPSYTGQIHCRDGTQTTFQTVSEGAFRELRAEGGSRKSKSFIARGVDERSAYATLTEGDVSVTMLFVFDERGHIDHQGAPYLEEYGKVWDLEAMQRTDQQPGVTLNKTCWNRYGNVLVFSVRHAVEGFADGIAARRLGTRVTEALSGPILFLPRSELSEEDTLELVLRDLCEVDVSAPAPEWVSEFVAPGQDRVDREIESTRARIEELIEELLD